MKNWFQKSAAAVLTASMLVSQAVPAMAAETADAVQEESLKIAVLSDTHYLSPDLIRDTADFTEHLNSDRKMFAESDAFLTALLNTVKQDDPACLSAVSCRRPSASRPVCYFPKTVSSTSLTASSSGRQESS